MNFQTVGEMIVFRNLEVETRSGVPHYKVGQHKARIAGNMAQLSYVDVAGSVVMIVVNKDKDGDWVMASPTGIRAGHFYVELVNFPRSFRLTTGMIDCLKETEKAAKKKGAAVNKKSKATPVDKG